MQRRDQLRAILGNLLVALATTLALTACWPGMPSTPEARTDTVTSAGLTSALDVDGYRFETTVRNDPTFSGQPVAPWAWSSVEGVGLRCEWTRVGAEERSVEQIWGSADAPQVGIVGWDRVPTGKRATRESGLPEGSFIAPDRAEAVCGVRDSSGDHGVHIVVLLEPTDDAYLAKSIRLSPWRGQ